MTRNHSEPLSPAERRSLIQTRRSPSRETEFLIRYEASLPAPNGARLKLRLVPDALVPDLESLEAWLDAATIGVTEPETLALLLMADLNNEVVPRWIQVTLCGLRVAGGHAELVVEDQQPDYMNASRFRALE